MKFFLLLLPLLAFFLPAPFAGEPPAFAAIRAADEQRRAATIATDVDQLSQLLSDDLHYAHADGRVQTKNAFLTAVRRSSVKYLSAENDDLALQVIAPGAVSMHGRTTLIAETDGQRVRYALRFLAIWRQESGAWRLLAYQSARLTP